MFYCYIIYYQVLVRYYVGSTSDILGRLRRHRSEHKGFTGSTPDWELKWKQGFIHKADALKFERQIKSWKSKIKIEELIDGRKPSWFRASRCNRKSHSIQPNISQGTKLFGFISEGFFVSANSYREAYFRVRLQ